MELLLFVGLCFHILMSGSDGAVTVTPIKRAVLTGTERVVLSCTFDQSLESVSWSFFPVGGTASYYITTGLSVVIYRHGSYEVEQSGYKQINLIILRASGATAGIYFCDQGSSASAVLIVIETGPECSMYPYAPTELLYNQAVEMACSISYWAHTDYAHVDMIWSKDNSATNITSSRPQTTTSYRLTTAVSIIIQTPGNFTPFSIYRCKISFRVTGYPSTANDAPDYSKSMQLFSSPINIIYLKPANENSITGARSGDQVYPGTNVTCNVEGNPKPNYSWLDVMYGNTVNTSTMQILHSGEFQCSAWNRAASTSVSINVKTYVLPESTMTATTPDALSYISYSTPPPDAIEESDGTENPVSTVSTAHLDQTTTQTPSQATAAPTENTAAPSEATAAPYENTTTPYENTTTPYENTTTSPEPTTPGLNCTEADIKKILSSPNLIERCFSDWSRCSPVTRFFTGILWDDCPTRCKFLGFSSGDCVPSPSVSCPCMLPENAQCICR